MGHHSPFKGAPHILGSSFPGKSRINRPFIMRLRKFFQAILLSLLAILALPTFGQQEQENQQVVQNEVIEEVVTTARFLSAAESLTVERLTVPFSADFLSAEVIARAGDSDIASALRRVPGLTVVDGKFVYVRGLGERYSNVTVNGAAVPSPELSRSVIPLDLFPTSMVRSIKIQKSPSPDVPAGFGGGAIDIRTTNAPNELILSGSIGLGSNDYSDGSGLIHPATASPMPAIIRSAIDKYRGNISVANIFSDLRINDPVASIADARTIHQGLLNNLDTSVAAQTTGLDNDYDGKFALGNSWDINNGFTFGALFNATVSEKQRNENQRREAVGSPKKNYSNVDRTIVEERTVMSLNLGLDYGNDHSFALANYIINSDEAEASIARGFDQNYEAPDQKVNYSTRVEKRELNLTQISGTHTFLDTPFIGQSGGLTEAVGLENLTFDWFFSESSAKTDMPNSTVFQGNALLDSSGKQLSTQLLASTTSGQFSFLNLDDNQTSWGGDISLPIEMDNMFLTLSGGWWGTKKDRDYRGYNINLNSVGVSSAVLDGGPGDVLTTSRLTVANGFDLSLGSQFGTESYVAAQKIDAGYGMIDAQITDNWRATVGARYEEYQQASLPVNLLDYTPVSIQALQSKLQSPTQRLAIIEDDIFGSAAITYDGDGLMGSSQYQIRLSYGQTVVRPDLREVSDVVFIDPELKVRVAGNPSLRSSPIDNIELRTEFLYDSGDNFSVSLFSKNIKSPIEQIRSAGTDDNVVLSFVNAETGKVSGIELEGLKTLYYGFFVSGNFTVSESEVALNSGLSTELTNLKRRMTGHSDSVINVTFGYDSDNGQHSAYLNYNAFGERIFYAGTGGNQDAFEQPFNSLGLVYKYFPTPNVEVEFKLDNILDERRLFEQANSQNQVATVIDQHIGRSFGLSGRWFF